MKNRRIAYAIIALIVAASGIYAYYAAFSAGWQRGHADGMGDIINDFRTTPPDFWGVMKGGW